MREASKQPKVITNPEPEIIENKATGFKRSVAKQTRAPEKTDVKEAQSNIIESKRRMRKFGNLGGKKNALKPITKDLVTINEEEDIMNEIEEMLKQEPDKEESKRAQFDNIIENMKDLKEPFKGGLVPSHARTLDVVPKTWSAPMVSSIDRLRQVGLPIHLHEDHFKAPQDEFDKIDAKLCKDYGIKRFGAPKL